MTQDISFASSNNFVFVFDRLPDLLFHSQTAMLPTVGLRKITKGLGTIEFKVPGTIMDLEDFQITFNVDENLRNYLAIASWMFEAKRSEKFASYMSDCKLIVLNNSKNPIVNVYFRECWPVNLTSINYSVMDSNPIPATASFTWHWYDIEWVDASLKPNVVNLQTDTK